ncbi:hypothetical protein [Rhodobaculum claviforme]|uniref:Uncharacterized protein n=1 Tax=Rhodobaculum claviforme TaxID=1549854 RepID=A0A934TGE5_9RHOB|nr:hypothetical protein [Rhodobaculum claviforme]MBK5926135.1 hypothetical protein [Rhodobaculum claviforme]
MDTHIQTDMTLAPDAAPRRRFSLLRVFRGGAVDDLGRLPRYAALTVLGLAAIWGPVTAYLMTAPLRFTSEASLILPGAGTGASVNLERIGQASSAAASPFANTSVSPTVTYQRLLGAGRILDAAAAQLDMAPRDFGEPRIRLIDQTGLIRIEMTGNSPEDARARARALLDAFGAEVDALRRDEIGQRETGGADAIARHRDAVARTRVRISALQRGTGLMSPAQYGAMVETAEALSRELGALTSRLSERAEAVAALQSALDLTPALAAATLKLHADSGFAAIVAEMSEHAALEARLSGQFGPNHPRVTDARGALAATLARARDRAAVLTGLGAGDVARLDLSPIGGRGPLLARLVEAETERAALAAEHRALTGRVAAAEARVAGLIDAAAELEELQRDHSVGEAVLASALARSDSSRTDLYVSYPLVQVLEDPSLPEYPTSPRRKLAAAAGAAGSLFLLIGLGMGWLRRPLIDKLLVRPQ